MGTGGGVQVSTDQTALISCLPGTPLPCENQPVSVFMVRYTASRECPMGPGRIHRRANSAPTVVLLPSSCLL